jgi:hypothetical protein
MVSIKSTDKRLCDRDIWPGLPWNWKDTHRIQDECRRRAIETGITEEPNLSFAASREYSKYMSHFPSFGDRQKIMSKIYPMKPSKPKLDFTEEELKYLADRLFGANDELGQNILIKIQLTL